MPLLQSTEELINLFLYMRSEKTLLLKQENVILCHIINTWTYTNKVTDILPILDVNMNQNMLAMFYLTKRLQAIWLILIQFLRPR